MCAPARLGARAPSARGPRAIPGLGAAPGAAPAGLLTSPSRLPRRLRPPAPQPRSPNSGPASAARRRLEGREGGGGKEKKVNSLALRAALPSLPSPRCGAVGTEGSCNTCRSLPFPPPSRPPTLLPSGAPSPAPGSFELAECGVRGARSSADAVAAAGLEPVARAASGKWRRHRRVLLPFGGPSARASVPGAGRWGAAERSPAAAASWAALVALEHLRPRSAPGSGLRAPGLRVPAPPAPLTPLAAAPAPGGTLRGPPAGGAGYRGVHIGSRERQLRGRLAGRSVGAGSPAALAPIDRGDPQFCGGCRVFPPEKESDPILRGPSERVALGCRRSPGRGSEAAPSSRAPSWEGAREASQGLGGAWAGASPPQLDLDTPAGAGTHRQMS